MAYNNQWERPSKDDTMKCASYSSNFHAISTVQCPQTRYYERYHLFVFVVGGLFLTATS